MLFSRAISWLALLTWSQLDAPGDLAAVHAALRQVRSVIAVRSVSRVSVCRRVARLSERLAGRERAETAALLGRCWEQVAQEDLAVGAYREALRSAGVPGGLGRLRAARVRARLGRCLWRLGKRRAALAEWARSLAVLETSLPPGSPDLLRLKEDLARGLVASGRSKEALPMLAQLVARWRRFEGMDGPVTADLLLLWGRALVDSGRFEEAKEILERSLRAHTTLFGPWSREADRVRRALVALLWRLLAFLWDK